MPGEMKIDAALADLEAGKFSIRMVDAIKSHIERLEGELEVTRRLHASAVRDLKLQEYANWRLESELRSLNARIHALIRANVLTEEAYRKMAPIAAEIGRYFSASLEFAGAQLARAADNLRSGKASSGLGDSTRNLYGFLKERAPTEKTFMEARDYAIKLGASLQTLEKRAASIIARAKSDKTSG